MGVYPFMFGCAKDFPEIIDEMEKVRWNIFLQPDEG
jgi:hypothetical protein